MNRGERKMNFITSKTALYSGSFCNVCGLVGVGEACYESLALLQGIYLANIKSFFCVESHNVYICTSFFEATKCSGCSTARLVYLVWDQGVAGSNPATPTSPAEALATAGFYFIAAL